MSGDTLSMYQPVFAAPEEAAAVEVQVVAAQQAEVRGVSRFRRLASELIAVATLVSGGAIVADAAPAAAKAPQAQQRATKECNDFTDVSAAANHSKYNSDAGLKKASVILKHGQKLNTQTAGEVVYGQFSTTGPLAGKGDKQSLAEIMAAIVVPSQDGVALSPSESSGTNTSYNYINQIDTELADFTNPNGSQNKHNERLACLSALKVMTKDAQYNPSWAKHGDEVLLIQPIRDKKNNHIVGWKSVNIVLGEKDNKLNVLSGIEYVSVEAQDPGFPSVLETAGGEIYVKGVVEQPSSTGTEKGATTSTTTSTTKPTTKSPSSSKGTPTPISSGAGSSAGKGTGSSGSGSGSSGTGVSGSGGTGSSTTTTGGSLPPGSSTTTTTFGLPPVTTVTTTTAPSETTTTTAPIESTTTTTVPYCEEYPDSDECKSGTVPTLPQS